MATIATFQRCIAARAGRRCQALHSAPRSLPSVSCRARRCVARVMAFRWGEPDTSNTATTDNGTTKPSPPSLTPSSSSSSGDPKLDISYSAYHSPIDEAIEEMQREERVRDLQRSAVEAFEGAKGWWDELPDKRSVLVGGAGLAVAAYLGSAVLSAMDRVPLVPGLLQAVGFGFSCWFWWRFVLFAEGRRELASSLGQLRRTVAERVDGLAEKTLESHPNPGSGETGATETARQVVGRMAARHNVTTTTTTSKQSALKDDGSWVDEPTVKEVSPSGVDEGYVAGLLQELDERARSGSPGSGSVGGSGGVGGGRPPSIFAFVVSEAAELWAAQPGAEEAASAGGSSPSSETRSDKTSGIASSGGGVGEGGHAMADLDPCLGWDTEACRASGHLKLGEPDNSKLDSLAEAAFRSAKEAITFSHHVDQVLHEPTSHGPSKSLESVHLEGEYGRAAGEMERKLMEDIAANHPEAMKPNPKSTRKPAMGEEAGL